MCQHAVAPKNASHRKARNVFRIKLLYRSREPLCLTVSSSSTACKSFRSALGAISVRVRRARARHENPREIRKNPKISGQMCQDPVPCERRLVNTTPTDRESHAHRRHEAAPCLRGTHDCRACSFPYCDLHFPLPEWGIQEAGGMSQTREAEDARTLGAE